MNTTKRPEYEFDNLSTGCHPSSALLRNPGLCMTVLFTALEGTPGGFGPIIFSSLLEIVGGDREPQQTNSPNMEVLSA